MGNLEPVNEIPKLDFSNTEIAFAHKSDRELKRMQWLYRLLGKQYLVNALSGIGMIAIKYSFPFAKTAVKNTIFKQFCGGVSLKDSQTTIDQLYNAKIQTLLDYGAEGKSGAENLDMVAKEFLGGVDFAAENTSVPIVVVKLTGIGEDDVLIKKQSGEVLSKEEESEYKQLEERLDSICAEAKQRKVGIFIDAEESWMQDAIDELADKMMARYNRERVVVYNTFQLYRHDRLDFLIQSHEKALANGYLLGAKLVRGAYMEKERKRAKEMGYLSPIHKTKDATDLDYNKALRYCLDNYETIASCAATHNEESCFLQSQLIQERKMPNDHPHLNFCQLLGMSDNITFNLAANGYNVSKYVVYGKVKEVLPYLVRRAQENTSVSGDMSRELTLIAREIKRREST